MNKRKTIIFGGSFDPIHNGHLALATEALNSGLAAEVWFMVTPQNPHKQGRALSDEQVRLRMVQLALERMNGCKACDFEFSLPRPSYTLHTLEALRTAYPGREFLLLIGADNWEKFDRWYKGNEILDRHEIVVYPRGNTTAPSLPQGVRWLPAPLCNVSSTKVREALGAGEDIAAFVPPAVAKYIMENKKLFKNYFEPI